MEREITWKEAMNIGLSIGLVSVLAFLISEVFWGQQIKDYLILLDDSEGNYFMLTLIIFIGFFIGIIITLITSQITAKTFVSEKYMLIALLLTIISNLFLWIAVSYVVVLISYPGILDLLSFWEKLIMFPRMMVYFAIYILKSVPIFWISNQITFTLFFIFFLKFLRAERIEGYNYSRR